MKLVACPQCHAQYDLAGHPDGGTFDCRCGQVLEARAPKAASDALAERCGACGALARQGEEVCAFCGSGIVPSVDPGSLICPECFARNLDEARFCVACGVAFAPQPIPGSGEALRDCPCCRVEMKGREIGGLEVQECIKCHGVWAPADGFPALIERASETARAQLLAGIVKAPRVEGGNPLTIKVEYRSCPVCDAMMARRNYQKKSGVIIDQCHEHGTWLDAHELEAIAGFVLSGRARDAAAVESDVRSEREREAANAAVRRISIESVGVRHENAYSNGSPAERVVGTIIDLFTALID